MKSVRSSNTTGYSNRGSSNLPSAPPLLIKSGSLTYSHGGKAPCTVTYRALVYKVPNEVEG